MKTKQTKYVLGFLFTLNKVNVMLIEKDHLDWQKGKLNGVGGHIGEGESLMEAMCREESGDYKISGGIGC